MKKWHIFNPEHDMALAAGTRGVTPPAAGRGMRHWLGFLPAFWAHDGDVVIVDDLEVAQMCTEPFRQWLPEVAYITLGDARSLIINEQPAEVDVWGWDLAIRWQLIKAGVINASDMPDEAMVEAIRRHSHREASISVLRSLVEANDFTVGERCCMHTLEEVCAYLENHHRIVVKAPWSCSGRGVRYFRDSNMSEQDAGFVANIIRQQGAIVAEPWYDKVMDLAFEFTADGMGKVAYEGLSLFDTSNGAYTGNLLLPEEDKLHLLSSYIALKKLSVVKEQLLRILARETTHVYAGPLGVDMMVVSSPRGNLLHPCVEINLRRTMGHVALSVAQRTHHQFHVMRVVPGRQYQLLLE